MKRSLDIASSALLPLVALVVLVLAGRGAFRSADTFPLIFAAVVIAAGVLSLLPRRRRVFGWRTVLVGISIALSLGAVVAHDRHLSRARRAVEEAGMEALSDGPAPRIPYSHAVNLDSQEANAVVFGEGWTVLNFWATWCDPCREEMPVLEEFWQQHRGEALRLVGVTRLWGAPDEDSVRQGHVGIERFVAAAGVTYPIVVADERTIEAYHVRSWPTSVLIGPDSRVVSYGVGIDGAEVVLEIAEESLRQP